MIYKCVLNSNEKQFSFFKNEIKENLIYLQSSQYGKKLLVKIQAQIPSILYIVPSMRRSSLTNTQKKIFEVQFDDKTESSEDDNSINEENEIDQNSNSLENTKKVCDNLN